ncbi:MAG: ribonuclease Z [Bacteroidetes bacterium]|nr:ribonuclease Z [Bacteroidota bacterium]
MEITILGTSSAIPIPGRNLSGTVLKYENEHILFDCGEGTQFSIRKLQLHPSKIKTICITHLHGDHAFGLPGLISGINYSNKSDYLTIIGPQGIKELLDVSQKHQQFFADFPIEIRELEFMESPGVVYESAYYSISAVSLNHRIPAFGYRFDEHTRSGKLDVDLAEKLGVQKGPLFRELKEGRSVLSESGKLISPSDVLAEPKPSKSFCYITDTRYCSRSIALAKGCDLMMHEATYLHELKAKADETGHSTALEAAMIAKEAGVKKLVLFHYSARYPNLNPLYREAISVFPATQMGNDLETLRIE